MWREIDNASIRIKLLIAPLFAVLALALTGAVAFDGFRRETDAYNQMEMLAEYRIEGTSATRVAAAQLQASLFRLATLALMHADRPLLTKSGADAILQQATLAQQVSRLVSGIGTDETREALQTAFTEFEQQNSNAVANVLNNPGWGATTARNAGLALEGVIARAADLDNETESAVNAAEAAMRYLNWSEKLDILTLMLAGSVCVVLASLVVARRLSAPVRRLTEAMARLADKHYDAEIPATAQRDEVGSMARAVQVFREGMLRADALWLEQLATQRFLDAVLDNTPAPIAVKDAATMRFVHLNRANEVFLGVSRDDIVGKTAHDLFPAEHADPFVAKERAALAADGPVVEDGVLIHTPGHGMRLAVVTRVAIPGDDGAPRYLLTMVEDVTERRHAEQQVTYMARYDALTDLPNRAMFGEQLAKAVRDARTNDRMAAVLCIDLDHFKEVNDTLGHAAGDKLLRTVANRMRECMRDGDTLARLGGDEFAVILPAVRQPHDAEVLARRLVERVREAVDLDGQQVYVGLSIGIALSAPGLDDAELVKRADMALYEAKGNGRGRFSYFAPEMDARLRHRRALEQDLRAAIGSDQLVLHYQPQVDLASGAIVGVEALMRWNRPGHGLVPPDEFIPLAEDTGLIGPLGVWLLEEAAREAASWADPIGIAINISPVQFRQPGFLETVRDALAVSGLDPHRLEMEVTEGILLHDTEDTLAILAELRGLGIKLAMDDFGTGYASLGYLQKFRFDKIKIDKSFIRNLATDPNASAIVRAVVGLSESLGMCTNAEGVEEQEQVDLLRAHGCAEAQGFRFWRPMPAADLRGLLHPAAPVSTPFAAD